jgi:hypothetical protein
MKKESKICIKCNEEKPLNDFNASSNPVDSLIGSCKNCLKEYNALYYRAHTQRVLENQKIRRANETTEPKETKEDRLKKSKALAEKYRIEAMPIFPDHSLVVNIDGAKRKKCIINSTVRVHLDDVWEVKVYLYPVETVSYIRGTKDRKELLLVHLSRCLIISKYLVVRRELVQNLPCLKTLDKRDEDFTELLWHCYS